jgi:hypothetical protein
VTADLLAAVVRGERVPAGALARLDPDAALAAAHHHGLVSIVADRLDGRTDLPVELVQRFRQAARGEVAADLAREAELRRCLDHLQARGVPALVMKGAQLAYALYDRPDLRPRIDTDLLVPPDARTAVDEALVELGYRAAAATGGRLLMYQATYVKRRGSLAVHAVDVHWKVANPQIFADLLAFDELDGRAVPLPRLCRHARGLSSVDALLVACVHRVAHHYDSDCLIWIYDIHLTAARLSSSE